MLDDSQFSTPLVDPIKDCLTSLEWPMVKVCRIIGAMQQCTDAPDHRIRNPYLISANLLVHLRNLLFNVDHPVTGPICTWPSLCCCLCPDVMIVPEVLPNKEHWFFLFSPYCKPFAVLFAFFEGVPRGQSIVETKNTMQDIPMERTILKCTMTMHK